MGVAQKGERNVTKGHKTKKVFEGDSSTSTCLQFEAI